MRLPWARGRVAIRDPAVAVRTIAAEPCLPVHPARLETGLRAIVRKPLVQDGGQEPGSLKNPVMTLAILSASSGA